MVKQGQVADFIEYAYSAADEIEYHTMMGVVLLYTSLLIQNFQPQRHIRISAAAYEEIGTLEWRTV